MSIFYQLSEYDCLSKHECKGRKIKEKMDKFLRNKKFKCCFVKKKYKHLCRILLQCSPLMFLMSVNLKVGVIFFPSGHLQITLFFLIL